MERTTIALNRDWIFKESFEQTDLDIHLLEVNGTLISLPHTHKEIPYNSFDEKMYQFVSCYKKTFSIAEDLEGKRVLLNFEGVMTYAKVFLNGEALGEHKGGYTPFTFDITDYLDHENLLVVMVDGTEREDIPPFGFVVDYLGYAGIYREVFLEIVSDLYITQCHTSTRDELKDLKGLSSALEIRNVNGNSRNMRMEMSLFKRGEATSFAVAVRNVAIEGESFEVTFGLENLENIELWSIETPHLYDLTISLSDESGRVVDEYSHTIGFRTVEFMSDGFYLNHKKIVIRGLNRHQSFPYVGYAMPKRAQVDDADILKYDLGLNLVRTSHYPQSKYFLDRCDEIGLLVFEEIPGWQHIGNEEWQAVACDNVREMIRRDYNHPSIILWGVRINESGDHHDFYTQTNAIAHALDKTRQTGGVRCITDSELLEDVYTFNDFIYGDPNDVDQRILRPQQEVTGLNHPVPYLVTEYNGHLFPTKRYDQIQRQEEHVRRHLGVINETALTKHTAGSIGWCAFDYNTHYQFGSSDRICYHGVMDMFRIPKFAAHAYTSQISPKDKLVLEPVLVYAMGDKSLGGITPLTVLTNVDYIDYVIEDKVYGRYYKNHSKYAGLEHPPIVIEGVKDVWGSGFNNCKFIGYIEDEAVIEKSYVKNPIYTSLNLVSDHDVLSASEPDTTRVVIGGLDQIGNVLNYLDTVVEVEIDGPAELIGPKIFSLINGSRAFWIKTIYIEGIVTLKVKDLERGFEASTVVTITL